MRIFPEATRIAEHLELESDVSAMNVKEITDQRREWVFVTPEEKCRVDCI